MFTVTKPALVFREVLVCILLTGIVSTPCSAWSVPSDDVSAMTVQCRSVLFPVPVDSSYIIVQPPALVQLADSTAGRTIVAPRTMHVTGVGMPPNGVDNPTVRREMAERAALSDAERKLVQAVADIKLGVDSTVRSMMGEGNFTRRIDGFIKGYRVAGERELDDGTIEIDLELPLTGSHALSRILDE